MWFQLKVFTFVPMKKETPRERYSKRKLDASKRLWVLAHSKMFGKKSITSIYVKIGLELGLTGQTVYNYVHGRGGCGYMTDALIEEFEKMQLSKTETK